MLRQLWPAGLILLVIFYAAFARGGDQVHVSLMVSFVILVLCAVLLLLRGVHINLPGLLWLAGAAGLYLIGLTQGWVSTGADEYASLVAAAAVFLLSYSAGVNTGRSEALWALILAMGAVLGFAAFVDFVVDPDAVFGFPGGFDSRRMAGPFLSPNTAATFYGIVGLAALASLLRTVKRDGRIDQRIQNLTLPSVALLISATCLLLSASRAGISLFVISAIALTLWDQIASWRTRFGKPSNDTLKAHRNILSKLLGSGLPPLILAVVFGLSGKLYADRVMETGGYNGRAIIFDRYAETIWNTPVFGEGLGGFGFANDILATASDADTIMYQNAAHNIAFQWILQTGPLGSALALALLGSILFGVGRGLIRRRRQLLILRAVLIIAVFVLAHGMVDYAVEIPAVMWLFTFILGLGLGGADGGRSISGSGVSAWPIRAGVMLVLAGAAGLTLTAGLDRVAAVSMSSLDDAMFKARYPDATAISGSSYLKETIGDRALRLDPPDPALAYAAFNSSLKAEPRNGIVWAKAAFSLYQIIPVIGGSTEEALRQSYLVMPYADIDHLRWRLDFMANAWSTMPEDLREAAIRESRMLKHERRRWIRRLDGEPRPPYTPRSR